MDKTTEEIEIQEKPKEIKKQGKILPNLEKISSNPIIKANKIKKGQLRLRQLTEELEALPMPRTIKNDPERKKETQKKRKKLSKEIKKLEKTLTVDSEESKEIIFEDERNKMNNLSAVVDYEIKDFKKLDVLTFERHKKAFLLKAQNHYADYSKMFCAGLLELSAVFDELPYGGGTQKKMIMHAPTIQNRGTAILIDMGMKQVDPLKYINPYTALGLSIALPVLSTFASNYMGQKKKTITEDQKKKTSSLEKDMNEATKLEEKVVSNKQIPQ